MSQCDKGMLVMELEGMAVKYLEHGGEEQRPDDLVPRLLNSNRIGRSRY